MTPQPWNVIDRLRVLERKLEAEGSYVRANTVFLAILRIQELEGERDLLRRSLNMERGWVEPAGPDNGYGFELEDDVKVPAMEFRQGV
jgi:hypothetical protein